MEITDDYAMAMTSVQLGAVYMSTTAQPTFQQNKNRRKTKTAEENIEKKWNLFINIVDMLSRWHFYITNGIFRFTFLWFLSTFFKSIKTFSIPSRLISFIQKFIEDY